MSLKGKLVIEIEVKSSGDLFHELIKSSPHQVPNISPGKIQGCGLHKGSWGTAGSVLIWNYTIDGKEKVVKDIAEAIDEETKMVRFKVIEGDVLNLYKNISFTVHVDTKGANHLVTWTVDYEKLNQNVPEPYAELEFVVILPKISRLTASRTECYLRQYK